MLEHTNIRAAIGKVKATSTGRRFKYTINKTVSRTAIRAAQGLCDRCRGLPEAEGHTDIKLPPATDVLFLCGFCHAKFAASSALM
jgi:hypothetical protein